jgi:hypothetical protein
MNRLFLTVSLAFVAASLAAPAVRADVTKLQCVQANTEAQSLRRDGKLSAARAQLAICSDRKCPALVATDCTKRRDELEQAQPTIVFEVKDGAGADLRVVKVSIDNTVLAEQLDGTAMRVDPGSHVFTFEVAGQAPVKQELVIREGEKDRREKVVLGAPPPPPPAPPPPAPTQPPQPGDGAHGGWSTLRTAGAVTAGAGVAGLVVGAAFGLMASSKWSSAQNECQSATSCANYAQAVSDHDATTTYATISTIGFIAGGALAAGGAVMFLLGGNSAAESPQPAVSVAPAVAPGVASLSLRGSF